MKKLINAIILAIAVTTPLFSETVTFKTSDGWTLTADYYAPGKNKNTVVMFHGLGAGRGEWKKLENRLTAEKIGWLAVDFRGHGESLSGPEGRRDYKTFTSGKDWQALTSDIKAAFKFLRSNGIKGKNIVLAGASIGANLALGATVSGEVTPAGLILLS